MANDFEKLQVIICYIFVVVDASHIPIIAPFVDSTSYYRWKGFFLVLLQDVVDAKCKFWDYDFQWIVHCHDWTLI